MAPLKATMSSPFSRVFVSKQVVENDEKLKKLCTIVKKELGLVSSVVTKQGQIKLDDKRHVIKVIGDVLDDILKNDNELSPEARRDLINMAVNVLHADPELGIMRTEPEQSKAGAKSGLFDFDDTNDFVTTKNDSNSEKLERAVSAVDLRDAVKKKKQALRREASMPAIPPVPPLPPMPELLRKYKNANP